jgi:hypothetical protein
MSADEPELQSWVQDFLFGASLYAAREIGSDTDPRSRAYHMFVQPLNSHEYFVDGYCRDCQKDSTFRRGCGEIGFTKLVASIKQQPIRLFELICMRDVTHKITFVFRLFFRGDEDHNLQNWLEKIGQYPSLADIANDQSQVYRQVLEQADAAELYKAIGLAAHGVGVGSFVYLRRVFERLITHRFTEFKDSEGWSDDDFAGKRMEDKIDLLKDHLPEFLIRNRKLYAILSKGIHELSEQECLDAFEFLKRSTFFILDDDRRKKEELEGRRRAGKAIASFLDGKGAPE